jgi:hypothetical protein
VEPVRPQYGGACISNVVRALQGGADWLPDDVKDASAVVLLVLDGLGWDQLHARRDDLPTLGAMHGGPITSVLPSTTPTALSSITTGLPPAEHGIVGYRIYLGDGVLNVIRWAMQGITPPDPLELQPRESFSGQRIPVVNRAQFRNTKFTDLLYRGAAFEGYMTTTGIVERTRRLVEAGERFVYAYYDGPDMVAHIHGLHDRFFALELEYCDALVSQLLDELGSNVAVVVIADHGHVHFTEHVELGAVNDLCVAQSGESRFRYLHAKPGAAGDLLSAAQEVCAPHGVCFTRDQLIDEGWLGPRAPSGDVRRRIGDVICAATGSAGFVDPDNPGESRFLSGHGSFTPGEMLVPLIAARGRR